MLLGWVKDAVKGGSSRSAVVGGLRAEQSRASSKEHHINSGVFVSRIGTAIVDWDGEKHRIT